MLGNLAHACTKLGDRSGAVAARRGKLALLERRGDEEGVGDELDRLDELGTGDEP